MIDSGQLTERWGKLIIDQLIKQGVRYFCLSPGSRSTPLAIAAAEHPEAITMVHFDERGTAFHALGFAKATGRPAAVITTSGTAVGNLLPAIMEASLSFTPLILLTADRPAELRDIGSNQTLDQIKIFSDYVRWEVDVAPAAVELPENYIRNTVAHAVFAALGNPSGPVQVNCQFREPFFSTERMAIPLQEPLHVEHAALTISEKRAQELAVEFAKHERGLIIIGGGIQGRSFAVVDQLAEKLGWPIFCDVSSGARSEGPRKDRIPYYDLILKTKTMAQPDLVLHLGDRLVSKTLTEWLAPKKYYLVAKHSNRFDPKYRTTHRIQVDPLEFCGSLLPHFKPSRPWGSEIKFFNLAWKEKAETIEHRLGDLFTEEGALSEPGLFHFLKEKLNDRWALFFANSMPVRDAETFLFSKGKLGPIFTNRGVSGIDGNIATAAGIAQGSGKPTLAIIGDQTALHDINSLAQLKKAKIPVVVLIINNGGGAVFSFLPIGQKEKICEEYFAGAHDFTFEHAARLFHLPYFHPRTKEAWEELAAHSFASEQSAVIEITTSRFDNHAFHRQITEAAAQASLVHA